MLPTQNALPEERNRSNAAPQSDQLMSKMSPNRDAEEPSLLSSHGPNSARAASYKPKLLPANAGGNTETQHSCVSQEIHEGTHQFPQIPTQVSDKRDSARLIFNSPSLTYNSDKSSGNPDDGPRDGVHSSAEVNSVIRPSMAKPIPDYMHK